MPFPKRAAKSLPTTIPSPAVVFQHTTRLPDLLAWQAKIPLVTVSLAAKVPSVAVSIGSIHAYSWLRLCEA